MRRGAPVCTVSVTVEPAAQISCPPGPKQIGAMIPDASARPETSCAFRFDMMRIFSSARTVASKRGFVNQQNQILLSRIITKRHAKPDSITAQLGCTASR